jgi:hypothetical protein
MDTFTRHYLLAALWTTDPNPGQGEWTEHDEWTIENIAPESIDKAMQECERFQDQFAALFIADAERNGCDFWLTRNGHGAGFWDRGYGAIGELLTKGAHDYGTTDLYLGDDGRLYLT